MDILSEARSNYTTAASCQATDQPKNSNRWTLFQEDMRSLIRAHGDISEAIAHAQTCGFDHRGVIAGNESKILLLRHVLFYEYPHFAGYIDKFSDSPVSIPATLAKLGNGQLVSDIMYFHMLYILTSLTFQPQIETVCEIGGGYGGPARLWLTNPIRRIKNYTIVDLPESLFYAETFLRAACPDAEIVYCKSERDCRNDKNNTFYLVPIHLAQGTAAMRFDLITNTGSLAELSDEWVDYWSKWLQAQQCNLFYSHNYFGIPVGKLFEARNIIAPATPPGWRVGQLRMNHPLMILTSADRNSAELLLTRTLSAKNRNWIYQIQRLQEEERLTLREFAYYLFNLPDPEHLDVYQELKMLKKAIADLRFLPKELLYLVGRIESSQAFGLLKKDQVQYVRDLSTKLKEIYAANFPQGRHAE